MQANLAKTTDKEIYFRFNHWFGWPFIALSLGGIALWPAIEEDGKLIYAGFLALMFLLGLLTALRRAEVRLDLKAHRWQRRVGFWPNVAEDTGPLSDVKHVEVSGNIGTDSDGDADLKCRVDLHFEGDAWEDPLRFGDTGNEMAALHMAKRVAEPLGIPVETKFMGVKL